MTDKIRRKNFLVVEGRLLATGKLGQLTAEEWIYLYHQIKDQLMTGPQATLFAGFKAKICAAHRNLSMDNVAL